MKLLNGSDIASFITERQARQVRGLRQSYEIVPKLAIIQVKDDPVINTYVRLKEKYGEDILVDVDTHKILQQEVTATIKRLNSDQSVHGIIVQLPLIDTSETDTILNLIAPEKDIDGLGDNTIFDPATSMAIMWLLAGYNVELKGKKVLLIGHGRLVGAPLEKMLLASGVTPEIADRDTTNIKDKALSADVIITAAGAPAILHADMIKPNAVVVDAGVASEDGRTIGDVAPEVYERDDLTITPVRGGVGPLTVCSLFDNVIRAARNSIAATESQ